MKFTAVGDILCQRRMAEDYEGFAEVKDFIEQGDARFFNLETTVNYEGECYGNQFSGGTYIRCEPEVVRDMLKFGFNLTTFNNNHVMDFAHEGLIKTIEYVNELDIVHGGVGMNLHEASAPAYLETKNGRVALIAVNTSFLAPLMAGEQSRRIPGRPGINGLTVSRRVILPKEDFERIKEIGEKTKINDPKNVTRAEGYYPYPPDDVAELGDMEFQLGDDYGLKYEISKSDLERFESAINDAKMRADYIIVSVHSHQLVGTDKTAVPDFLRDFCHHAIDIGADAVVGHGPHLLRPVEVYQDKPIFYSLGDFVIQLYDVKIAPEDFYKKYGLTSDSSAISLLEKRSNGFTRGLMEDARMRETVIPCWECDKDKKLTSLVMLPVTAAKGTGYHLEGLPQPSQDLSFVEKFAEMSKPYGVEMELKDGLIYCKW